MRHTKTAIALAALSLALGGCAALGLGDTPDGSVPAENAGEPDASVTETDRRAAA